MKEKFKKKVVSCQISPLDIKAQENIFSDNEERKKQDEIEQVLYLLYNF